MTTSTPLTPHTLQDSRPWYQHMNGYHWFVLIVASMAWFFDCLDQRTFSLARGPALDLLKITARAPGLTDAQFKEAHDIDVLNFAKNVTAFFLVGWGIGGLIFGALGDKFGRSRMLKLTVLIYSVFTQLTFFSKTSMQFTGCRFLTGLGIGGVFGLAVSLIAETVPSVARAQALGLLQILSAVGNASASFVKMGADSLEKSHVIASGQGWRYMFLVGALPGLMVIFAGHHLKEPEAWLRLKEQGLLPKGNLFSPYARLLAQTRWRKNLLVGALLASTGVVGLWAIGEYAPDLQKKLFDAYYAAKLPAAPKGEITALRGGAIANAFLLNQVGAALGMWIFTRVALGLGRRPAFLIAFTAAMVTTALVYWKMTTPRDAYWMMPLMGAAQLGAFAGFSIYLPELFPGSMRSTGTSFCYNIGRFAAAGGSFFSSTLSKKVFNGYEGVLPLRYSAMTMCGIFLIGLLTLPFAPETRGKPLPSE